MVRDKTEREILMALDNLREGVGYLYNCGGPFGTKNVWSIYIYGE